MKTKLISFLLLSVAVCAKVLGQSYPDPNYLLYQQQQTSDFIIEGELLSERYYPDKDNPWKYRYQIRTYKILKVFKGLIDCGTIEVLTRQTGSGGFDRFMVTRNGDDSDLVFGEAFKYSVLFLKKNLRNYYNPQTEPVKATVPFRTRADYGFICMITNEVFIKEVGILKLSQGRTFNSYNDFRTYFDKIKGMANPKICAPGPFDSTPLQQSIPQQKKSEKRSKLESLKINRVTEEEYWMSHSGVEVQYKGKTNASPYLIEFDYGSVSNTGTNKEYVEFDVYVKCDQVGTYLSRATFFIQYNTALFGTNVSTNSKIFVEPNISWDNYEPSVMDISGGSNNVVGVGIDYDPTNTSSLEHLTTANVLLCRVYLETNGSCNIASNIAFHDRVVGGTHFTGGRYETSATPGFGTAYDNFTISTTAITMVSCVPGISTISTVSGNFYGGKGGAGDVLTINGWNFGSSQGSGKVYFLDANNPTGTTYKAIDPEDYVSGEWSDNQIKIRLSGLIGSADDAVPCCSMQVSQTVGSPTPVYSSSPKAIDIKYSIMSYRVGSTSPFEKLNMFPANKNNKGGYNIVVEPSVYSNKEAMRCIRAAMDYWTCKTGINWRILDSYTITDPTVESLNECYIEDVADLRGTDGQPKAMITTRFDNICPEPVAMKNFRIRINSDEDWYYQMPETGSWAGGSNEDFYESILHELGHALGLDHIATNTDVMWYMATPRLEALTNNSIAGSQYFIDDAVSKTFSCSTATNPLYGSLTPTAFDLSMIDFNNDRGNEPDYESEYGTSPKHWNIWNSPDIWNRLSLSSGVHTNPQYTGPTGYNYLYWKVRAKAGCRSNANGTLKLYWTLASTGEKWPNDWTGLSPQLNGYDVGGALGSPISISSLAPGSTASNYVSWVPPRPQNYDPMLTFFDVCILARIETASTSPYGMSIIETNDNSNVGTNVFNNNNIVTRNMIVYNLNGFAKSGTGSRPILFSNTLDAAANFDFVLSAGVDPNNAHNFFDVGYAAVYLGEELFGRWVTNGSNGSSITVDELTYSIRLNSSTSRIEDIDFTEEERQLVQVSFHLFDSLETFDADTFYLSLSQHRVGAPSGEMEGSVVYEIDVDDTTESMGGIRNQDNGTGVKIFPTAVTDILVVKADEPISQQPTFEILDVLGRKVMEEKFNGKVFLYYKINAETLSPGVYFIRVSNIGRKPKVFKFVKH